MSAMDASDEAGEAGPGARRRRGWIGRVAWAASSLTIAAMIVAGGVAATGALHERAAQAPKPEPSPPLPVATVRVQIEASHLVENRYAGLVEPARETALAFERSGLVLEVLADEGDRVAEGAVVARLDDAVMKAQRQRLEAQSRQLEAQRELALRTSGRRETLVGRGFASDQTYDEARYEAEALSAQIDAVAAEIRALDIDLAKSALAAPFAGEVAERHVDEGAVVAAGAAILELQETGRPMARIGAPPEVAASLEVGSAYAVEVAGAAREAALVAIAPRVEPGVRTVDLIFAIDAEEAAAPIMGEIARLNLSRSIEGRGFWLPIAALQEGEKGLWTVYTVGREPGAAVDAPLRVGQAAVETLHVSGDRVFVRGALSEGDRVVASGVNRIARGQIVALGDDLISAAE